MENLLFILLIAVAGFLKWLADKASEAKRESEEQDTMPTSAPPPIPRASAAQTEEERVRKFLEALGVPTSTPPPPPVKPKAIDVARAAEETRRRMEQLRRVAERKAAKVFKPQPHIPPLTTVPPPLHETPSPPPPISTSEPEWLGEGPPPRERKIVLESPVFEVGEVTVVTETPSPAFEKPIKLKALESYEAQAVAPRAERSWGALLATPEGLRQAIILREIFGPPRSLQPLEQV